ncbi:MAG: hypothetical protein FGM37_07425 [Phycisphaerales bacterium]|nr:hypothetical protein [Phycisphaerales bacterium]
MMRFTVSQDSAAAPVDPGRCRLLGVDEHPVGGSVHAGRGELAVETEHSGAIALCVPWDAGPMGSMMVQTCLLQQRDDPYRLSLEIARQRIKLVIAKAEEWQVWDHPSASDALAQLDRARRHFTEAMTSTDPAAAETAARRSIATAIDAGERLAVAHGQVLIHRRFGSRAASSAVLGMRIDASDPPARCAPLLGADVDVVFVPLDWPAIEPEPGAYDFADAIAWLDWAVAAGKRTVLGPVVDLAPGRLPEWLEKRRGDHGALRDAVWGFAEAAARQLSTHVGLWSLARGLHVSHGHGLSVGQVNDLVRRVAVAVRGVRRNAPTLLEVTEPFADGMHEVDEPIGPWRWIVSLISEGIHIDVLHVHLEIGESRGGRSVRDLLQLSALLDRMLPLQKKVFVEFGAPSSPVPDGGVWRAPWSPDAQASWATRALTIAMSKPHVELVAWHRLRDDAGGEPAFGAAERNFAPKPVLGRLVSFRRRLRQPLGPWTPPAAPVPERKGA